MGGGAGAAAVPAGGRRLAADVGVQRGEQGRVRGVRATRAGRRGAVDRRGVPRRPRAGAHLGHADRDRGAAPTRRSARQVGLPITVGVARTKFLAKVASAVAKPDGLLVVPPARRAWVPAPAAGRAAVGRRRGHRRASCATAGSRRSARSRDAERGDARSSLLGPRGRPPSARARPQPRSAAGPGTPSAALDRRPAGAGPRRQDAARSSPRL